MVNLLYRISLGIGLAMLLGSQTWADAASGAKVFTGNSCQDCHYTDGPAKEKTIADQLAKKGPELWYAGSKFKEAWLNKWLQDPQPIRPMKYNSVTEENPANHPKLAAVDAGEVTTYLMSLVSDKVKAGVIKAKKNPKGKLIFKKKMPCGGCHRYVSRKKQMGGKSGPSLVNAGERLNPDWIYAYMSDPKFFKPVKAMPDFTGVLNKKQIEKVSAHVASF